MGTTLLVPLDGSTVAEAALPYAEAIARATGGSLTVFSVLEELPQGPFVPRSAKAWRQLQRGHQRERRHYVHMTVEVLNERGLKAAPLIVSGEPVQEILAAASRDGASMIVMATHGRGGVQRMVIGSVADKVIRTSSCPVLVVQGDAEGTRKIDVALTRLLVPLDGPGLSEAALAPATELAAAAHARVTLARVEPWLSSFLISPVDYLPDLTEAEDAVAEAAAEYLKGVQARLPATVESDSVVLRGPAALTLSAFARNEGISLIVMTTHGRGGIRRLALGSVADRLVRDGLPALLINPGATASLEPMAVEAGSGVERH